MTRRSLWDHAPHVSETEATPSAWDRLKDTVPPTPEPPQTMLEQLRPPAKQHPPLRNRAWEKQHPSMTYRLVPPEVREAVKEIAHQLGCTTDILAETLLQYGHRCYQRGDLRLQPQPTPHGLRLYPEHYQSTAKTQKLRWSENHQHPQPPKPKRKTRQRPARLYRQQVTYRLSPEIRAEIARLSQEHQVPPGEVVTRFLQWGIEAYQSGKLVLEAAAE
jgi:hypothetical protein